MPRLLLLLPTSSYQASDFLAAAHRLEVDVVVGSQHRQALAGLAPDTTLALPFNHLPRAVEQISAFARRHPLQAIVGTDDRTAVLAARASQALALPHNPPASVQAANDKYRMRCLLHQGGAPSPRYALFPLAQGAEKARDQIRFPCVLKPVFLAASRGVIRADDPDQFDCAWARLAALLDRSDLRRSGGRAAHHILVEDYIPGTEVALEGLLQSGRLKQLALFDKPDPLEGPFFAETLYLTPSRLPVAQRAAIGRAAQQAATAMGLREGPLHAELRLNDQGIFPIELAARTIGGLCARMLRFGTGLSLEELVLAHALGQPVDGLQRRDEAAGAMMLPVPHHGILRRVEGQDAARLTPDIEQVAITIPPGQPVEALPEGDRYLGFILARGKTPAQVEKALRRATACIDIQID